MASGVKGKPKINAEVARGLRDQGISYAAIGAMWQTTATAAYNVLNPERARATERRYFEKKRARLSSQT